MPYTVYTLCDTVLAFHSPSIIHSLSHIGLGPSGWRGKGSSSHNNTQGHCIDSKERKTSRQSRCHRVGHQNGSRTRGTGTVHVRSRWHVLWHLRSLEQGGTRRSPIADAEKHLYNTRCTSGPKKGIHSTNTSRPPPSIPTDWGIRFVTHHLW